MQEPTSGLDARAAAVVMRTIRNTVDTGAGPFTDSAEPQSSVPFSGVVVAVVHWREVQQSSEKNHRCQPLARAQRRRAS